MPLSPDKHVTEKDLPVLIGHDYEHVMAKAVITQEPDKVLITIEASGERARTLGDFVAANEIIALSFTGVPVRRPGKKE